MAKILLDAPIAAVAGSISKHQQVVYRMRNGRTHAYVVMHPNEQPPSDTQKRNSSLFGEISKQVHAEMADPAKRTKWEKELYHCGDKFELFGCCDTHTFERHPFEVLSSPKDKLRYCESVIKAR